VPRAPVNQTSTGEIHRHIQKWMSLWNKVWANIDEQHRPFKKQEWTQVLRGISSLRSTFDSQRVATTTGFFGLRIHPKFADWWKGLSCHRGVIIHQIISPEKSWRRFFFNSACLLKYVKVSFTGSIFDNNLLIEVF
jgi:hypothetical protein